MAYFPVAFPTLAKFRICCLVLALASVCTCESQTIRRVFLRLEGHCHACLRRQHSSETKMGVPRSTTCRYTVLCTPARRACMLQTYLIRCLPSTTTLKSSLARLKITKLLQAQETMLGRRSACAEIQLTGCCCPPMRLVSL